ncbi:MAG: anaerobic ribonucleoside-triphosphate reductase [Syntrophales bacterium]|jgi:ribonucleoside-triphosphate reductase|nr:anaerobic ribonucleoside-triphosphate reductase [Syntrophales bacterium]MCK9527780.1 anaerobic ribonucleoside-triphosphate reductase [Syntrophales bacterium]MDX9922123.1 anaerobic ribonucleoside-triphosphate reductase [Syntrophales bacterium]
MDTRETTDLTLFVRTSSEDIAVWNRQRIIEALIRETNVDVATAESISREVEQQITSSSMGLLTTSLIREMVNARLLERGLEGATKMHARLGFPFWDVDRLMLYQNKENANVPHSPEGTNLIFAEGIKREYALMKVFSDEVSYAHLTGDIHLHHLGYIDRPYCSCQSLEYIKKFGLNLPNSLATAAPARHAEVLLAHMVRFAAALQGHFSGAIGWLDVNILFAPYLEGMSDAAITQLAQMLVYEFAQQAVGRGGQTIFTDIHLQWEVPARLRDREAIGPGGTGTGKCYGDYDSESRRFLRSLFDVYLRGDASGRPFVFPRPMVHLTEDFFSSPEHEAFLMQASDLAAEKGNPSFLFDRQGTLNLSECGLLEGNHRDDPWNMRYSAIQNVSINLPRLAYKAGGDEERLFFLLEERMELAARAHEQKKYCIERLLSHGDQGPLSLLTLDNGGTPYLLLPRASWLIGIVGLNEMVKRQRGSHLHESDDARLFGLKVVGRMREITRRLTSEYGMNFILEQSPAESTPHRFARLDLKYFSPEAGRYVRGDIARGEVYYTNSTCFDITASVDPLEKVSREGVLHPCIGGEALSHLWLGANRPAADRLASFIAAVFRNTTSRHITFSPDFSTCRDCKNTSRGLMDTCPLCGSADLEGMTRITGYYSKVSSLNRGKIAELRDRRYASFS